MMNARKVNSDGTQRAYANASAWLRMILPWAIG